MLYRHFLQSKVYRACLSMALASSFLLAGYEFIRCSSTSLLKSQYGVASFPLAMALIPLSSATVLILYNLCLSAMGPRRTLGISIGFSGLMFLLLYFAIGAKFEYAALILFLFREAYVTMIVEQYWSFINSVVTEEQSFKLSGTVMGLSTFGGVLGGALVYQLAESLGSHFLILLGTAALIPCFYFSALAYKFHPNVRHDRGRPKKGETTLLGLKLFPQYPILWVILLTVVASQAYSTTMTLAFQNGLDTYTTQQDSQTAYMGLFFSLSNGLSMVCQWFLIPRIMGRFPSVWIHKGIAMIHVSLASLCLFFCNLWTVSLALLIFKALDYSLFRAAKEVLFIPLPFDARFRSKEWIDVLGFRGSKGVVALGLSGIQALGVLLQAWHFSAIGVVSALLWILGMDRLSSRTLRKVEQREDVTSSQQQLSEELRP